MNSQEITRKRTGEFSTPDQLCELIGFLASKINPTSVLDPACGTGNFLQHLIKFTNGQISKIKGVDISTECISRIPQIIKNHTATSIQQGNSLIPTTIPENEKYDLIFCDPPLGMKVKGANGIMMSDAAFLDLCLKRLTKKGYLFFLIAEGFLFRNDRQIKDSRTLINERFNLKAILSFPTGLLAPYSGVKTSLLIIQNINPTADPILFADFKKTNFDKKTVFEALFESGKARPPFFNIEKILSKADFNFKKHLPLEYLLGIPKFNYPLLRTDSFISISPIKSLDQIEEHQLVLRRVGNFKIVNVNYLTTIKKSTLSNYSLLRIDRQKININYLKLIFESDIFQKQAEQFAGGLYIKSLPIQNINAIRIPLPPLDIQSKIAGMKTKIDELSYDVNKIKNKILSNPFDTESVEKSNAIKALKQVSTETLEQTLEDIPSPIASMIRQNRNPDKGKSKLENSVSLFEVIVRFMTFLVIAEVTSSRTFGERGLMDVIQTNLGLPSLGQWISILRSIVSEYKKIDQYKEMAKNTASENIILEFDSYMKCVDTAKVTKIRNDFLGHGAAKFPDEVCEVNAQTVDDVNKYLLDKVISPLKGFKLVYVVNYKMKKGSRIATVKLLMGDNRDFLKKEIEVYTEIESEAVILLFPDFKQYVVLDPLIHYGICDLCKTENVFYYDKRKDKNAIYLSYSHHHKPKFNSLLKDI